jgi:signal transduction histidine kinase
MPALTAVSLLTVITVAVVPVRRPAAVTIGACATVSMSLVDTVASRGPADTTVPYWLLLELVVTLPVVARAVRRLPVRAAVVVGGLLVVAVGLSPLRVARSLRPPAPAYQTLAVCGCFAVLAGLAVVVGAYLRALDRARALVVHAARREQQLRLARDLHDWFAHEVTGIVLEAQVGQLHADERTAGPLARIEQAGLRALGSLDRAVALMREDAVPRHTLQEIGDVVRHFAGGGVEADLDVTADLVSPETADAAHQIVLESLTNLRRHGGEVSRVVVRVRREGGALVVSVADDGAGRRCASHRGGSGLAALTERVTALGGTLGAGPGQPAGWTVRAVLPVWP